MTTTFKFFKCWKNRRKINHDCSDIKTVTLFVQLLLKIWFSAHPRVLMRGKKGLKMQKPGLMAATEKALF